MNKTKIDWCDSTWNPVTGCFHDCEYCYARSIATRFGGNALGINHVLNERLWQKEKYSHIRLDSCLHSTVTAWMIT